MAETLPYVTHSKFKRGTILDESALGRQATPSRNKVLRARRRQSGNAGYGRGLHPSVQLGMFAPWQFPIMDIRRRSFCRSPIQMSPASPIEMTQSSILASALRMTLHIMSDKKPAPFEE